MGDQSKEGQGRTRGDVPRIPLPSCAQQGQVKEEDQDSGHTRRRGTLRSSRTATARGQEGRRARCCHPQARSEDHPHSDARATPCLSPPALFIGSSPRLPRPSHRTACSAVPTDWFTFWLTGRQHLSLCEDADGATEALECSAYPESFMGNHLTCYVLPTRRITPPRCRQHSLRSCLPRRWLLHAGRFLFRKSPFVLLTHIPYSIHPFRTSTSYTHSHPTPSRPTLPWPRWTSLQRISPSTPQRPATPPRCPTTRPPASTWTWAFPAATLQRGFLWTPQPSLTFPNSLIWATFPSHSLHQRIRGPRLIRTYPFPSVRLSHSPLSTTTPVCRSRRGRKALLRCMERRRPLRCRIWCPRLALAWTVCSMVRLALRPTTVHSRSGSRAATIFDLTTTHSRPKISPFDAAKILPRSPLL